MGLPAFRAASEALLAKRRDQRGYRTLGDEHDLALARALSAVDPDPAFLAEVEGVGESLGRDVYARRFFEDHVGGATEVLSSCLRESGLGALRLESHFHRHADLRYEPSADLGPCAGPLVTGAVRGFFGSAFNCAVTVEREGERIHVRLLDGRDVNRGSSA
jgi:hypothetical protein